MLMSEPVPNEEILQTPEEAIRGMGQRILGAIDEIIAEYGWDWSKKPLSEIPFPADASAEELSKVSLSRMPEALGRRFNPQSFEGQFQEEAYCMDVVLQQGKIPKVQMPERDPFPYGILINLRAAPEFHQWYSQGKNAEGISVYQKKTSEVMEKILIKLGFLQTAMVFSSTSQSQRITHHTYIPGLDTYQSNDEGQTFDYSWILESGFKGLGFTEITHPTLPWTADIVDNTRDIEPPLVFIRYTDSTLGQEEQTAVSEAERWLRAPQEATILPDEELKSQTREILKKMGALVDLLGRYPKHQLDTWGEEDPKFVADLDDGSEISQQGDFFYFHSVDQKAPLKSNITFLMFENPEEGREHAYTLGVETDNLLMIDWRERVEDLWQSERYFLNPQGVLCQLIRSTIMTNPGKTIAPVNDKAKVALVSSTLDALITKLL